MRLQKKLRVTKEQFFDMLLLSVKEDIKRETNKEIKEEKIKSGYSYQKKLGNNVKATIKILNIEYSKIYEVSITSVVGENRIKYLFDENNVIYEEKYYPDSLIYTLNYILTYILLIFRHRKRAKMLIESIEEYILNKKNN